jgi:SAM-dependent methyltransferase
MAPEDRPSDKIDHVTTQRYWKARSGAESTTDPRTVTLARVPGFMARLEVSLYQSWSFRAIDALKPGMALSVDLACGLGTWSMRLAERTQHVAAVDFSAPFVAATERLAEENGIRERVTVSCGNVLEYAIPTSADIILAGAFVQYLSDDEVRALLGRVRSSLASDGVFYLRTTVSRDDETVTRRDADYEGNYRPIAWYLNALAAAGFDVRQHRTAMRFVPAEINRRWFVGWLVAPFWYLVRSRLDTDVCAFVCSGR